MFAHKRNFQQKGDKHDQFQAHVCRESANYQQESDEHDEFDAHVWRENARYLQESGGNDDSEAFLDDIILHVRMGGACKFKTNSQTMQTNAQNK